MNPDFYKNNPFRPPQWRAERAIALVTDESRPLPPRRYDDRYVRTYRRFMLSQMAAGIDETQRMAVFLDSPHVYQAHLLRYADDSQWRQILEARLLTDESLAQIAARFSTEEPTIDYYEKLFFNVRDRLQHKDWVAKIILGTPESRANGRNGVMTDDQRGFVYQLFAHHGGPLVLDAMISGIAGLEQPLSVARVGDWLDRAHRSIIQSRAMMAAKVFEINRSNVMHVLKLALRSQQTARITRSRTPAPQTELEQEKYLEQVMAQFHWDLSPPRHANMPSAEPRADDRQPSATSRELASAAAQAKTVQNPVKRTTENAEVTLASVTSALAAACKS